MLWGMDWDSAVNIATGYRLDIPGIESQWGRNYLHPSTLALRSTQPPIQRAPILPRGKVAGA